MAALLVLSRAAPAFAGNDGFFTEVSPSSSGGAVEVSRSSGGSGGSGGGEPSGRQGAVPCFGSLVVGDEARAFVHPPELVTEDAAEWVVVTCWADGGDPGVSWIAGVFQVGEPALVSSLLDRASDLLVVPEPVPALAPPPDALHLVGIAEYLAVDASTWRDWTAVASVPGLSVSLTASPLHTRWDLGNGDEVVCDGPGEPWSRGVSADDACTYIYRWSSTARPGGAPYQVVATTVWTRSWTCSPACGSGALAPLERSVSFPLAVQQAQAIITHS